MTIHTANNNNNKEPRIVINATEISADNNTAEIYEFVLDLNLKITSCSHIKSISQRRIQILSDYEKQLRDKLFELNHVRVNPMINNDLILHRFKKALELTGVKLKSPPDDILMAICYKPLGELENIVRFYIKDQDSLVFMSDVVKLTVV